MWRRRFPHEHRLTALGFVAVTCLVPNIAHAEVVTGQYTGNGADSRNILYIGFQPDIVVTVGSYAASNPPFRTSTMSGDISKSIAFSSYASNRIQALLSDGFQIGTDADVND